jgi:hypothetical protein
MYFGLRLKSGVAFFMNRPVYSDLKNKNNPKPFWKYVKSLGLSKNANNSLYYGDVTYDEPAEQPQAFGDFFASVYTITNTEITNAVIQDDNVPVNVESFSSLTLSRQEVFMQLLASKIDKAKGPDNIPPVFFQKCAWEVSYPLWMLFNESLARGIFPTCLKNANVIPIFKKGNSENVENYRPISLLCHISKVFETIMHKFIYSHVKKYICHSQHGFTEGKSTVTNLLSFWNYVIDAIEEGSQVDAIYTDFSKAFDSVTHTYLIHKLNKVGVHGNILNWCNSYLSNRDFKVVYNGFSSRCLSASSGVPQGSALGPLFFLIYINDLAEILIKNQIPHAFYADDLKMFLKICNENDSRRLQSALNQVSAWCEKWNLKLNLDKCHVISFHSYRNLNVLNHMYTLTGFNLRRTNTVNDLGVTLQSNCLFSVHIANIVKKGFKMCGFLKRSLYFVKDIKTIITIYNAIVRSLLTYACIVWNPTQQYLINELERVQRNFIRYICFKFSIDRDKYTYESLCTQFKIPTLHQFRLSLSLNFLYNLIHNKVQCPELLNYISIYIPQVTTRNLTIFGIPRVRTDYKKRMWHQLLTHYCNVKNLNPFIPFNAWKHAIVNKIY